MFIILYGCENEQFIQENKLVVLILDVYVTSSVRNKITICPMKGTVTTDSSWVQVSFVEKAFVGWGIS